MSFNTLFVWNFHPSGFFTLISIGPPFWSLMKKSVLTFVYPFVTFKTLFASSRTVLNAFFLLSFISRVSKSAGGFLLLMEIDGRLPPFFPPNGFTTPLRTVCPSQFVRLASFIFFFSKFRGLNECGVEPSTDGRVNSSRWDRRLAILGNDEERKNVYGKRE